MLTVPLFFLTTIQSAATDYTNNTYYIHVAYAILMHHLVCKRLPCGQRLSSGSINALKSLGLPEKQKLATDSEVPQRQF